MPFPRSHEGRGQRDPVVSSSVKELINTAGVWVPLLRSSAIRCARSRPGRRESVMIPRTTPRAMTRSPASGRRGGDHLNAVVVQGLGDVLRESDVVVDQLDLPPRPQPIPWCPENHRRRSRCRAMVVRVEPLPCLLLSLDEREGLSGPPSKSYATHRPNERRLGMCRGASRERRRR